MHLLHSLLLIVLVNVIDAHYSVYHSDQFLSSPFGFDCLYAYLTDEESSSDDYSDTSYHLIPYCRRPVTNEERDEKKLKSSMPLNNVYNYITFEDLYKHGVTSEQLLNWSAPIDLAEQYVMNDTDRMKVFYNCSSPWFGLQCEYSFQSDLVLSFDEIVRLNFQTRSKLTTALPDSALLPCYSLLPTCLYKFSPACLDWREICDGKFDCVDGEDEQDCQILEVSECPDDTYRCHYGGQCIPLTFVRDRNNHFHCLDGTDETVIVEEKKFSHGFNCYTSPTFRCEEHTSRYQHSVQCGDGQYSPFHFIAAGHATACTNGRHAQLASAQKAPFPVHLQAVLGELFDSTLDVSMHILKPILLNSSLKYSMIACESTSKRCLAKWFFKVELPYAHSVFHLLFLPHRSFADFHEITQPDLICFDAKVCPELLNYTIETGLNNEVACCRPEDIFDQPFTNGMDVRDIANALFLRCVTTSQVQTCSHPSLFHCPRSSKCVSKHRLVDGIVDCYYREDETSPTCHLQHPQRFTCLSETNKCISPIALYNGKHECHGKEDEMHEIDRDVLRGYVSTGLVCDGQTHPLLVNMNETDETDCAHWPCSNPYTQCNSYRSCPDGADEQNCPRMEYTITEGDCSRTVSTYVFCGRLMRLMAEKIGTKILFDKLNSTLYNKPAGNLTQCAIPTSCLTVQYVCQFDTDPVFGNQYCRRNHFEYCLFEQFYWAPTVKKYLCRFQSDTFDSKSERKSFFTSSQLGYFPSISSESNRTKTTPSTHVKPPSKSFTNWFCNRGILIHYNDNQTTKCLCPPSYFGDRCEWQSQRVSLTLQFIHRTDTYSFAIFRVVLMLIDQHGQITMYHEQLTFIPTHNCGTMYSIYLLYPEKPKNLSANYSVHIDIFDQIRLTHVGSWQLPIPFSFLPVNRIAAQIFIPNVPVTPNSCPLSCGSHGRCERYVNQKDSFFCRCQQGYSGLQCEMKHRCFCSPDSLCLSPSICVCPLKKFGAKCYLNRTSCSQSNNSCRNNGLCVPIDDRMGLQTFLCLCTEGFYGPNCEHHQNRIEIRFDNEKIDLMPFVFVHMITAFETDEHQHTTMLKKVSLEQSLIKVYATYPFHIVFIELINRRYYLVVLREKFIESEHIQGNLLSNQECLNVHELINTTFLDYPFLRRIKSYPSLCEQNKQLACFYDERQICICDRNRFSNCLTFNASSRSYNCHGENLCDNDGLCFQDNPRCPTRAICVCPECYYGTRCQFSTRGFVLSLDYILGYHITPNGSLRRQPLIVKMSILTTAVMLVLGIANGSLSMIVFRRKKLHSVGCGLYLLMASRNSICLIVMLLVKFWHLLLSQMSLVTNRSYLNLNCVLLDVILKIFIAANDWLYSCVSIERVVTVVQGASFNQLRSQRIAKWVIAGIYILTSVSHLHDPRHRRLIEDIDIDEQRTWCIVQYSPIMNTFNVSITLLHFLLPFSLNLLATISTITLIARSRSTVQLRTAFKQHLREQFSQHKHRLIASCALLLLALPRLIISFMSGCMKSPRNPSVFLAGYLISFLPSMMTFIVFVLPAKLYKEEFQTTVRHTIRQLRRQFS